jgi:hypothetical protein
MAVKQDLLLAFVDCVERNGAKLALPRTVVRGAALLLHTARWRLQFCILLATQGWMHQVMHACATCCPTAPY